MRRLSTLALAALCATSVACLPAAEAAGPDGRFTRWCHSGEAAGSGACPASPAPGARPTDWGCTRDERTGLLWEVKTDDNGPLDASRTYSAFSADYNPSRALDTGLDASGHAAAANASGRCGARAWRLPSRRELLSIVDRGQPSGALAIDPSAFPNSVNLSARSVYWTGSPFASKATQAWAVDFSDGAAGDNNRSIYYAARLVHGPAMPPPRFEASADGSELRESGSSRVWRRCTEGQRWDGAACSGAATPFAYDDAERHVRLQPAVRGQPWRLPTVEELLALVDDSRVAPAIDPSFANTPAAYFWSATPSARDASYRWVVDFGAGYVGAHAYHADPRLLRLVRDER